MASQLGTIISDFQTQLASALVINDTTGTLISATDDDGVTLPNGKYFFTIDGDNSKKEHIACTLTGTALSDIESVSRQGVNTTGIKRTHRAGATVTITDYKYIKEIQNLLDGTVDLDGSNPLKYDTDPTLTDDKEIATKKYIDGVAIAGAPDAASGVKGITKLSTTPVSPTNPIAVGDNDTRVPTQDENDALAGTSGTPSSTNKYVTNDDTVGSGDILRASNIFFGDGSDGDVTISTNTTLTRDMYYHDLTINSGVTLSTGGFRIFGNGTLDNQGTIDNSGNGITGGKTGSLAGGADGGASVTNGSSYSGAGGGGGGVVWVAFYNINREGTINAKGGNGSVSNYTGSGTTFSGSGNNGSNISKTLIQSGTGGTGGTGLGQAGGAGGTISSSKTSVIAPSLGTIFLDTSSGLPLAGGAGGGSGGGQGASGGVGGGGGGQGGVIYLLFYTRTTTGTKNVSGGTGSTGGGTHTDGTNGSDGLLIEVELS